MKTKWNTKHTVNWSQSVSTSSCANRKEVKNNIKFPMQCCIYYLLESDCLIEVTTIKNREIKIHVYGI